MINRTLHLQTGDPVTADFTYIRWLDDRKAIEEITTGRNKLVIDRTAEMEEWTPALQKLLNRRITIYACFNNHYSRSANQSATLFSEVLNRRIGKRNAGIARSASFHARQTSFF